MRRLLLLVFLAALPIAAWAQDVVALKSEVRRFGDPSENTADLIAEINDNLWKEVFATQARGEIAKLMAFSRGDLQIGATSGASGTTAAVVSPLLPAIFGVAFEDGAITRSVSGTTVTLKVNPARLLCASGAGDVAAVALRFQEACATFWSRLGVAASFDASRGNKDPSLSSLQAVNSQFSEFSGRFEILNRRDVTLARVQPQVDVWIERAQKLQDVVDALNQAIDAQRAQLVETLKGLVTSKEWATRTPAQRIAQVDAAVKAASASTSAPEADAARARAVWLRALEGYEQVERGIANAAVITADYTFQRPDLAAADIGDIVSKGTRPPNLHTIRMVYAQGWPNHRLDVTANASASWFDEVRDGMPGRFRDARTGVEGKFKLRELRNFGVPTLSFAGLYVFLNQEPLGLGIVAFNKAKIEERGHIGVFQTKLEFPTSNNAVRIPLSLTASNRTELIKESDVRGQIGISFNLDALFAAK